jgi:hypothetical protein
MTKKQIWNLEDNKLFDDVRRQLVKQIEEQSPTKRYFLVYDQVYNQVYNQVAIQVDDQLKKVSND